MLCILLRIKIVMNSTYIALGIYQRKKLRKRTHQALNVWNHFLLYECVVLLPVKLKPSSWDIWWTNQAAIIRGYLRTPKLPKWRKSTPTSLSIGKTNFLKCASWTNSNHFYIMEISLVAQVWRIVWVLDNDVFCRGGIYYDLKHWCGTLISLQSGSTVKFHLRSFRLPQNEFHQSIKKFWEFWVIQTGKASFNSSLPQISCSTIDVPFSPVHDSQ